MTIEQLTANRVLRGPLFPEPVEVIVTVPMGDAVKLVGRGVQSGKVVDIILTPDKLTLLETSPEIEPFDGDPTSLPAGHRGHAAAARLRVRPLLLPVHRPR